MLDQARLAVVAYVEVNGADGSSTLTNSGVVTTKLATGTYAIDLPAGQYQASDRDLIFVQVKGGNPFITAAETDTDPQRKLVYIGIGASTAWDCDFTCVIYRTVTPPAPGGPA
jgi:hypothetical protein